MRRECSRSEKLAEALRRRIGTSPQQLLPFRDFMEFCLYHPKYGYYMSDKPKIGRDGDYYTSPYVGSIMGDMLGNCIVRMAGEGIAPEPLRIMEWGAGPGRLAGQILCRLHDLAPELHARSEYILADVSPYHRSLWDQLPEPHRSVLRAASADELAACRAPLLGLAHELLDAFPVHRIKRCGGRLFELHVGWDRREERFVEQLLPLRHPDVIRFLQEEKIEPAEGQILEVPLDAVDWWRRTLAALPRGSSLIAIDYGDTSDELYATHRMHGTLMCYRGHRADDDPYSHVGEKDITAHVNFTPLMRISGELGWEVLFYASQKQFLLDCGLLEELRRPASTDPFAPDRRRNRSIAQLLLTDGMSERFKVLVVHNRK
jgi:SAM-dependent MidA family methyltransferase